MAKDNQLMAILKDINLAEIPYQVKTAITYLLDSPRFISEHKLWKGYFNNIWVFGVSVLAAYLFTSAVYGNLLELITHNKEKEVIALNAETDIEIASLKELKATVHLDSLEQVYDAQISDLEERKKSRLSSLNQPLFSGFLKFILLLILEIVIYHFSVMTNNILTHKKSSIELSDFVRAEIRMFAVMLRNAVLGWIAWLILKIIFSILQLSFLHDAAYYMITAFYLGFAFLDNYLELFHVKIKTSAIVMRSHIGGALVIGLVASVFLLIPVIGPLFVPFVCSIAATRYGHRYLMEQHPSVALEE